MTLCSGFVPCSASVDHFECTVCVLVPQPTAHSSATEEGTFVQYGTPQLLICFSKDDTTRLRFANIMSLAFQRSHGAVL